jgi:hypothetical protein
MEEKRERKRADERQDVITEEIWFKKEYTMTIESKGKLRAILPPSSITEDEDAIC